MKILVATDGSDPSLHAVNYAVSLVRQLSAPGSSITLISVHDDIGLGRAKSFVGREVVADYLRELCEADLKVASERLDTTDIEHHVQMKTGHLAPEIVAFAEEGGFDMIMLGAKGRGAFYDLLLGSVAQRVLATATMPVLLVK